MSAETTTDLLHRYLSGELTAPQEAELERRALTDPDLREALEGLQQHPEEDHLSRIKAMVDRVKPPAVRRSLWPRYAAAATVLVLLSITALLLPRYFAGQEEAIAQELEARVKPSSPAPKEDLAPAPPAQILPPPAAEAPPRPKVVPQAAPPPVETLEVSKPEPTLAARPAASAAPPTLPPAAAPRRALPERPLPPPPPAVRGYVTTEDGEPIVGASILRPGLALGVTTDSSGAFELPYDATLREFTVNAEGYDAEEVELVNTDAPLQISLTPQASEDRMDAFMESIARQRINIDPAMPLLGQARPAEGYRNLRERIEREKPADVPAGRVRVSFIVNDDGTLSDFRFRGKPDRATIDYVGGALIESSTWEIVPGTVAEAPPGGSRPVRVYLKLRFE